MLLLKTRISFCAWKYNLIYAMTLYELSDPHARVSINSCFWLRCATVCIMGEWYRRCNTDCGAEYIAASDASFLTWPKFKQTQFARTHVERMRKQQLTSQVSSRRNAENSASAWERMQLEGRSKLRGNENQTYLVDLWVHFYLICVSRTTQLLR